MRKLIAGLLFCSALAYADEVQDKIQQMLGIVCTDYCPDNGLGLKYMRTHRERAVEVLVDIIKSGNKDSNLAVSWLGVLGPYQNGDAAVTELLIQRARSSDEGINARAYQALTNLADDKDKTAEEFMRQELWRAKRILVQTKYSKVDQLVALRRSILKALR